MGRHKKAQETAHDDLAAVELHDQARAAIEQEKLRHILSPFATWIYADAQKAQAVIDKYFKQTGR